MARKNKARRTLTQIVIDTTQQLADNSGMPFVTLDEIQAATQLDRKRLYGAVYNAKNKGALEVTSADAIYQVMPFAGYEPPTGGSVDHKLNNLPVDSDVLDESWYDPSPEDWELTEQVDTEQVADQVIEDRQEEHDVRLVRNAVRYFSADPAAVEEFLVNQLGAERTLAAAIVWLTAQAELDRR